MREPRKSPWAPKNKLIGIEYEDKAHYVVEEQDVMRSHYCIMDTLSMKTPTQTQIEKYERHIISKEESNHGG